MPKDEWGVKRACPKCATRFYDLQADPMTCPACGATFDLASLTQSKTRTVAPVKASEPQKEAAPETLDDDVDTLVEDDDAGDAILGDDILDEDDDTVNLDDIADVPDEDSEN